MKRQVGTFTAWDGRARRYTIHHSIQRADAAALRRAGAGEDVHTFRTSDGRDVRRTAKGKYVVLDAMGEVPVHSDSPDAP